MSSIASPCALAAALATFAVSGGAALAAPARAVIDLDMGMVGEVSEHDAPGLELGLALDIRTDLVTVGFGLSGTAMGFERSSGLYALRLGHTFALSERTALDLLGELGLRDESYHGTLLSDDPGRSRTTPFLGSRLELDYALARPGAGTVGRLGVAAVVRGDLGPREDVAYSYEDCFFGCSTEETRTSLGGNLDLAILFTVGIDIGPKSR